MLAGILLIAIGSIGIVWGGWWVPQRLAQVREGDTPQSWVRYDRVMTSVVIGRMRQLSVIVGGATVLLGGIYLIIQL
jgi:uncharacterized membrane protein